MASGSIRDHYSLLRRSTSEVDSSPQAPVVSQRPGCMFGCCVCICVSSRVLDTTPPTLLGNDNMSTWVLSHTSHCCCVSCSAFLCNTHTVLFFSLSYISITYLFIIVVPATCTVRWGWLASVPLLVPEWQLLLLELGRMRGKEEWRKANWSVEVVAWWEFYGLDL